ncbi:MAG: hypothetical protein JW912_01130 [Sedimentisphaerales bacterium]|nr:hypothetical protein [Sedimentisphaerales bacterium]
MKNRKKFKRKPDIERSARICLLVVGTALVFTAVGLFATTFFKQRSKIKCTLSWTKTNCVIESRKLKSEGKEYSGPDSTATFYWEIFYSYYVGGRRYASNVFNAVDPGIYLGKGTFLSYISLTDKQINEGTGPYPKNSRHICYVNPDNPEDVVLEHVEAGFAKTFGCLWRFKKAKLILQAILLVIGLLINFQGAKILLPDRYKPIKRD